MGQMTGKDDTPAAALDLIWGCEAIGQTIGLDYHKTYHLLVNGLIPARKVGTRFVIERSKLVAFFTGEAA